MVVQQDVEPPPSAAEEKGEKKHKLKQRFQVIRKLGQGTYGKVQLAINRATNQEVSHPLSFALSRSWCLRADCFILRCSSFFLNRHHPTCVAFTGVVL